MNLQRVKTVVKWALEIALSTIIQWLLPQTSNTMHQFLNILSLAGLCLGILALIYLLLFKWKIDDIKLLSIGEIKNLQNQIIDDSKNLRREFEIKLMFIRAVLSVKNQMIEFPQRRLEYLNDPQLQVNNVANFMITHCGMTAQEAIDYAEKNKELIFS